MGSAPALLGGSFLVLGHFPVLPSVPVRLIRVLRAPAADPGVRRGAREPGGGGHGDGALYSEKFWAI